ncbi:glycosyltransferase family 4 protein [Frigidibacter oleivorans]|uniref:glycosyltransferase family 4 protein n=1 Tax=Frigidibacter oleivorans TaxID=2487129 RepID=UPI000F8D7158|nr:glycosyltransferase family 4 protein [Frigidibacter oleivorans]
MSLRILMTLDAAGGVWRYAMDLARALRADVVFLGFGPPPSPDQRTEAAAIGALDWTDLPLDWMVGDPAVLSPVPAAVAEAAARHGADLIHLNLPTQAAGLVTDLPVLAVHHSCVATWFRAVRGTDLPPDWAWQRAMNAAGLDRADAVVAPSRAHAALMAQVYGPLPVAVVPNATPAPERGWSGGAGIVAAGRWWDEGKDGATLDRAAAGTHWPVKMIGPLTAPDGQAFRATHARTAGTLPHAATLRTLRDAGLFVSPSRYEPFGLAVAEAARLGLPLLLADIPTFRELWDEAALFFPPGDAEALTDAANRIAADPGLQRRLGEAARDRARRFLPEAQARAMIDLYARLIQPQPQAAAS